MEMVPQNIVWLIPEELAPCDLFLFFRGQFVQGVAANNPLNFRFFEKLAQAKVNQIYVKKTDISLWQIWQEKRLSSAPTSAGTKAKQGNQNESVKRAELISYLRKQIHPRNPGDKKVESSMESSFLAIQKISQTPMLDWYFQQFHEPPDLFYHNARVAFLSLYVSIYYGLLSEKENSDLIFSSLIHELQGDPSEVNKSIASEITLKILEKSKHPIPKEVIQLIQMQDEHCDGSGFPNGLDGTSLKTETKIFSIANHIDHLRLREGGTRKAKSDRAKQKMQKQASFFDSGLFQKFWEVCDTQLELP
jgi:hypothetical protein